MTIDPKRTALVVIDVQRGFDDPRWGRRGEFAAVVRTGDVVGASRVSPVVQP